MAPPFSFEEIYGEIAEASSRGREFFDGAAFNFIRRTGRENKRRPRRTFHTAEERRVQTLARKLQWARAHPRRVAESRRRSYNRDIERSRSYQREWERKWRAQNLEKARRKGRESMRRWRVRTMPNLTPEEKERRRLQRNRIAAAYLARNRDKINARRKASNWGRVTESAP